MSASPLERNAVLNSNPTSASGTTPFKPKSGSFLPVKENETAKTSVEVLKEEIKNLCFTVKYNTFYNTFLRDEAHDPSEEDLEDCLAHLRNSSDADCRYSSSPPSTYLGGINTKLESECGFLTIKDSQKEAGLYRIQSKLFTAIGNYVRLKHGDSIDAEWPRAKNPLRPIPQSSVGIPITSNPLPTLPQQPPDVLHRRFVFCPSKATKPVQKEDNPAELKLDMAMIIAKPNLDISYDASLADQPQFYWRDVMLPVGAKLKSTFNADVAGQVASYVRMVRVEQPDRNVVYTLTVNSRECRVWRWDASACYISEALNFHDSPIEFIKLVWRLHTMTPEDFGFDNHFSNAGRILTEEVVTIPTTLTIQGFAPNAAPNPYPNQNDNQHSEKAGESGGFVREAKEEVYVLKEKLFQSHGLFSRNPVVWKAQVLNDRMERGATVVIKQNWQDITRESEASYYDDANTIPGIAHLRAFQESDRTNEWWDKLPREDVTSHVFATSLSGSGRRVASASISRHSFGPSPFLYRVLLRMVFTGVGTSLTKAKDSQELLAVILDAIEAMEQLYNVGIMHRDISLNNILLNGEADPPVGSRGFLIDLGLAQRIETSRSGATSTLLSSHNHRTGTLPFMATDLLDDEISKDVHHEIHHDIESIFWVLFYICLTTGTTAEGASSLWIRGGTKDLVSSTPRQLCRNKLHILFSSNRYLFEGKFADLLPIIKRFAVMCLMSLNDRAGEPDARRLSFGPVKALIQKGLFELSQIAPRTPTNSPKRTHELVGLTAEEDQNREHPSADPSRSTKRSKTSLN